MHHGYADVRLTTNLLLDLALRAARILLRYSMKNLSALHEVLKFVQPPNMTIGSFNHLLTIPRLISFFMLTFALRLKIRRFQYCIREPVKFRRPYRINGQTFRITPAEYNTFPCCWKYISGLKSDYK